ncbi:Uu.00g088900.m01.CDS01 [Anthostomella pinea]|uniref:Uu.00g088900.m01.CDS01 n=1 Tax=Anthostomella pinea TaxID=933095 RepID=A0AAI8VMK9_9PEZI|nr:Uu.00g088900.m01.CDS01 [Anthostomella pinea]
MSDFIAALPMYDWPERPAEVDRQWAHMRDRLRAAGVDAPERLVRRNADMPGVPDGIRDADGNVIAPDPASLPPDALDLPTLWRHPSLMFAQTCWGPMQLGLAGHVEVVGQQDYSGTDGGKAEFYSSVIVARRIRDDDGGAFDDVPPPPGGRQNLPLEFLRSKIIAYNSTESMSGILALTQDLASVDEDLTIFSERLLSGGHRQSIVAVAKGMADVAAIDCFSWQLAKRFEPLAETLAVIGWTTRRKGLPFVASRHLSPHTIHSIVSELGGRAVVHASC